MVGDGTTGGGPMPVGAGTILGAGITGAGEATVGDGTTGAGEATVGDGTTGVGIDGIDGDGQVTMVGEAIMAILTIMDMVILPETIDLIITTQLIGPEEAITTRTITALLL